ncbi:MAG: T9SS type A sorting domain-containing protein [candidate division Zixibacteria bacterium]
MKRLIVLLATLLLSFGLTYGQTQNMVSLKACEDGKITEPLDTLRTGIASSFVVALENDQLLGGMGLGFVIWSDDGATWTWNDTGNSKPGPPSTATEFYVRKLAGTRMSVDGDDDIWDMGGFLVTYKDVDNVSPDSIMVGGVAMYVGLPVGPLEDMVELLGIPGGTVDPDEVKTLCIDSVQIADAAPFVYVDETGATFVPLVAWAEGGLCYPVTNVRNLCPEFADGLPTAMTVDHCGSNSVGLSATDKEGNAISFKLGGTTGTGAAIVTDHGDGTCTVSYTGTAADVGSPVTIDVIVEDAFNPDCDSWPLTVTVTNNAPTIDCGLDYNPIGFDAIMVKDDIVGSDADDCDGLAYALVPPLTGDQAIDGSTGVFTWTTTMDDIATSEHIITVSITDGIADPVTCTFRIDVLLTEPYELVIEKMHDVIQGHYVDLPIWITKGSEEMGGFDLLLAYDPTVLTFTEASLGTFFQNCGWEYFTYRYGSHGNCGNGCPSGEIRVVGMAETNNGPVHPDAVCLENADEDGEILVNLTFFVTTDVNANGQFAQVSFFWMDCGDNVISVASGDTLAISRFVYNYYGSDGMDSYIEVTDNTWGFPGMYGAAVSCETRTDKGRPIRFIDLFNGGIDIIDKDDIDDRGDINMNGLPNEIADAVMFTNYFITGLSAFGNHVDGSIAASDTNADGTALTIADLVYLVRVIIGDALPYATKPAPGALFDVKTQLVNGNMNVSVETGVDAGAALFVFDVSGDAGTPVLHNNMDVVSSFENSELRVLVYNIGSEAITSGDLMTIPVNGNAELISVEASDYNGSMMESSFYALPSNFSINQNYPNPFKPTTNISFNLSAASDWTIEIYNIVGQRVNTFSGYSEAGTQKVVWDSKDASGKSVASGIYFYKVTAGANSATMKMVLMK